MKCGHEEIKEILPDYACGDLPEAMKGEVRAHLDTCADCRADLHLLVGMMCIDEDDPGDLFRQALPRRVREEVRQGRSARSFLDLLFPLSLATAAVLLVAAFILTFQPYTHHGAERAYSYHDPLSPSVPDYRGLQEEDLPVFTEEIRREDAFPDAGALSGFGYYRELASLDGRELQSLAEALKEDGKTGG